MGEITATSRRIDQALSELSRIDVDASGAQMGKSDTRLNRTMLYNKKARSLSFHFAYSFHGYTIPSWMTLTTLRQRTVSSGVDVT